MVWHRHRSETKLQHTLRIKARKYRRRWIRRSFYGLIASGILCGLGVGGYWFYAMPKLSSVFVSANRTNLFANQTNVRYLNSDGHCFYQTNLSSYKPTSKSEVESSKNVVNALVATEDRDFFKEGGVNWGHTVKAGVDTFSGKGVSGGSTITQQLIKLSFFSTNQSDQTIRRKFQEIVLATQLDHKFSKMQILTWYLNKANYGNGQQGIKAAAKYYYNKKPEQLDVLQSATLIGMVNSPTTYNPYWNPKAMMYRRNVVLRSMQEAGYLSKNKFDTLSKKSIDTDLVLAKTNALNTLKDRQQKLAYNGFISGVNAQLSRYDNRLIRSTVTVKTTMNQKLQDQVNDIVNKTKYPDDDFQEAIVVLNNKTGQVVALSGGRNQTVLGGYNRAFNVKRSSGSAIKPLLDYAPGMDMFHWTGDTEVDDTAYNYPGTNTLVHDWDNQYQGKISLKKALVESRNVPAVKALEQVGLDNGKNVLKSLGFSNKSLFYANAIGLDTSPLTMASAYSSLANNGVRSNARLVDYIDNGMHKLTMKTVSEQAFSQQTAYLMTDILKGVFDGSGTATSAKIDGINEAGKTGTVGRDDKKDALTDGWMVGYTKQYTVCVWNGYDNPYDPNNYLTNDKNKVSFDLYKQVMTAASKLPGADNSDWTAPSGVDGQKFASNSDTSNDFRLIQNRKHSYVPFYLNMLPSQFLNTATKREQKLHGDGLQSALNVLYDHVNNDNNY